MKISEVLRAREVTISCELFPPKKGSELKKAHDLVREMAKIHPAFISVTYGATGGISEHTVNLANEAQNVNGVPALAHLTCASSHRDKIQEVLGELKAHNIENILALRGDIPEDADFPLPDQYHHASELIEEIKAYGDFCIGGACYPEGHPEAESVEADIDNLKRKVEAGCEFLTTQMFFDNNILYSFLYKALKKGIQVPVVAGIMPVTNVSQMKRIGALSGSVLPQRFRMMVERFADDPNALKQAGIAYATEQIIDLVANGVGHVHIYTMNKPDVAGAIMGNLSEIYKVPERVR
ncbi:MAG: methylenetetrahydrofolate reductase [NAD(P)H] [Lachnospiraceae bacterium]|jgi:methylenetetrahydrofolate reductase (NADPH)|nr:methylenetetrahydrofolate reductase [NAD(P)H] [Lachnospiraceae bacterium]